MRFYPALLFAAVLMAATGCNSKSADAKETGKDGVHTLKQLKTDDTKPGTGAAIEAGDDAWVMYKGTLTNGTIFDTNMKEGGEPFHLTVGEGQVIKGWDQGLIGMKEGGTRKLSIPANLAYGPADKGTIPPNSDLYFDVECKKVLKQKDAKNITVVDKKIGTGKEASKGSKVRIQYQLFAGNTVFEDSKDVKTPTIFTIGADQMQIKDFDLTIVGMKVGGVREVTIPPYFARMLHNEKIGNNSVRAEITLVNVQ